MLTIKKLKDSIEIFKTRTFCNFLLPGASKIQPRESYNLKFFFNVHKNVVILRSLSLALSASVDSLVFCTTTFVLVDPFFLYFGTLKLFYFPSDSDGFLIISFITVRAISGMSMDFFLFLIISEINGVKMGAIY